MYINIQYIWRGNLLEDTCLHWLRCSLMLQLDSSSVRCQGWSEDSRSQERVNNPRCAPLRARTIAAHRRQLRAMSGPRQLGLVTTSPGRHPPGRPPRKLLFHLFFSTNCWVDVPRVTFNVVGNLIFSASHLPSEGLKELEGAASLSCLSGPGDLAEISFDAQILPPSPRGRVEHVTTS